MQGQKCAECGLVNFADQDRCKRCQTPLKKLNVQPDEKRDMQPINAPSMYTLNGIGTRLIGWHHNRKDGTATATTWFTFLYLPIFPIARWGLLSPTKSDFEPKISFWQLLMIVSPIRSLSTNYSIVEQLPLSGNEVLQTYLYAYLWVPCKIYLPIFLLFNYAPRPDPNDGSMIHALIVGPLVMIWLGYVIVMMSNLMRKSRGGAV